MYLMLIYLLSAAWRMYLSYPPRLNYRVFLLWKPWHAVFLSLQPMPMHFLNWPIMEKMVSCSNQAMVMSWHTISIPSWEMPVFANEWGQQACRSLLVMIVITCSISGKLFIVASPMNLAGPGRRNIVNMKHLCLLDLLTVAEPSGILWLQAKFL